MLKRIALVSTFSTTFLLAGCAVPPKDGLNLSLPEPRPTTNESSYAMKVATAIQTTARCLGCKDTILWQDEKAMASSASFDTRVVTREEYKAVNEYRDRIKELNKAGKLTKENLPPAPKVVLNERDIVPKPTNGNGLTNGLMLANSIDGRWSNPGSSLGAGLALGLLLGGTGPDNDENRLFPPTKYMKLAFVLPEKIPFQKFNYERMTAEENERENVSCYGAAEFVRVMTKSAEDMGYKPVGELQYDFRDNEVIKNPIGHMYINHLKMTVSVVRKSPPNPIAETFVE